MRFDPLGLGVIFIPCLVRGVQVRAEVGWGADARGMRLWQGDLRPGAVSKVLIVLGTKVFF